MVAVTGSRPVSDDEEEITSEILTAIKEAVSRGVEVRLLLPEAADRLFMEREYVKAGAKGGL